MRVVPLIATVVVAAVGTESTSSLRYTSTYVKRAGQWRMLALQMQQRAAP